MGRATYTFPSAVLASSLLSVLKGRLAFCSICLVDFLVRQSVLRVQQGVS